MTEERLSKKIEDITTEIEQITNDLTTLHVREAVLRDKLNKKIASKIRLNNERYEQRQSSIEDFESHPTTIPVPATVVPDHHTLSPNRPDSDILNKLDRDGVRINIGDEVSILTKGQNTSNIGIVERISRRYVYIADADGVPTRRIAKNLRIQDKFHEC